jgi:hypothetical protein
MIAGVSGLLSVFFFTVAFFSLTLGLGVAFADDVVSFSIGSVIVRGVDNGVDFPQAVAGAAVHLERVESAVLGHIIDRGLTDAESFGNFFLGD